MHSGDANRRSISPSRMSAAGRLNGPNCRRLDNRTWEIVLEGGCRQRASVDASNYSPPSQPRAGARSASPAKNVENSNCHAHGNSRIGVNGQAWRSSFPSVAWIGTTKQSSAASRQHLQDRFRAGAPISLQRASPNGAVSHGLESRGACSLQFSIPTSRRVSFSRSGSATRARSRHQRKWQRGAFEALDRACPAGLARDIGLLNPIAVQLRQPFAPVLCPYRKSLT